MEFAVGTLALRIRVEGSRSLKDKRQVLRSLKDHLRQRHNVAVAEVGGQGHLREAEIVAVAVAVDPSGARKVLEAAHEQAADRLGGDLIESEIVVEAY